MPSKTRRRFLQESIAALVGATTTPAARPAASRTAAIQSLCLGHIAATKGEDAEALAYLTQALRLNPDATLALTERSLLLERMGHHQRAARDEERAYHLLRDVAQAGGERRAALVDSKDVARALADLALADPGDVAKRQALACWLREYQLDRREVAVIGRAIGPISKS